MIRLPRALFDWFTLPRAITLLVVVGTAYGWLAYRIWRYGDPAGAVLLLTLAPLAAALAAPALIGLVTGFARWVDERTWAPWQGVYHAFDDRQIRVVEARDRLWFSSDDVHAALGLKRRPAAVASLRTSECRRDNQLGEVLSNDGLIALFGASNERRALRLVRWADGEVRRPWQKRRDAQRRDPAAPDVSPPHRN